MQIHPGRGLGFLVLGASLHDILTRLKLQPQLYPIIDISYSPSDPLGTPVVLNLPENGYRLRFDGPNQRLRLIEILDFTKTQFSYKELDVVKLPDNISDGLQPTATGPAFRYVYNKLMGPTFPGEYIQPDRSSNAEEGVYILSYPGIAFNFPLKHSAWSPDIDFVSLLSSNAASAVTSLAVFEGQSWQDARQNLMTKTCQNPRSLALSSKGKEYRPDEIDLVRVRGNGEVHLERRATPDFQIHLNRTTPQDLVAELGPPDAIHRKIDRRLSIHKNSHRQSKGKRPFSDNYPLEHEDTTDTDQSSNHAVTDDSDMDDGLQDGPRMSANVSAECFYNYFHHGFDVFISYPTAPSPGLGHSTGSMKEHEIEGKKNQLVATKILLHANVPGSYPFNRYRRCHWVIDTEDPDSTTALTSEMVFADLSDRLERMWPDGFANSAQKAMVLNRDWGDSPGSSCEFLGDWEESSANVGLGFGNTKLYGFPGLLFEVLKNDAVYNNFRGRMIGSKIPWKKTLHLPKARFPSRPIPQDRPTYLKRCTDDLYAWQRGRDALRPFVLHDGPPYANGDLHVGHALNKILKDIICRARIPDHRVDWRPGWDCHGLPIELKALQQQGETGAAGVRDAVGIRNTARKLAAKTVQKQKQTFQKWAVMADWDHPWTTMDKQFVIKQLGVFREMVKKGLIYRRFKPVYWSPSSRTALAEAELEYRDDHVSRAAFVKYPLHNASAELTKRLSLDMETVSAIIWTTTPWTLPANRAIGIHRGIEYTIAESSRHGRLLIATSRISEVEHHLNEVLVSIVSIDGGDLIGVSYYDRVFSSGSESRPLLHADFVTESSGSGLVHFAPGHGKDEYELCLQTGIAAYAPVDENGRFLFENLDHVSESLQGLDVLTTGNDEVLRRMSERGQLISQHDYTHTYPYDWRSKQPVIVRATEQWFADLSDIRQKALQALEPVEFIPFKGKTRLETFIRNRSEWCISRQRAWGVPIPALYHSETGQAILTDESLTHIISMIKDRGIDAWWTDSELDPAWTHHSLRISDSQSAYRRGRDTMDVWFDSGTSWTETASSMSKDSGDVADCYIEGTDQHRGWFQSSLLTYVAQQDTHSSQDKVKAPFKSLITHGFTLDQAGLKMSKSVGNVVSPDEIMEGKLLPLAKKRIDGQWKETSDAMGPDVLRLWVAGSDYIADVKISQAVLQAVTGSYLKYRLTFKLMLGILEDFHPSSSICTDNLDRLGMIHQVALIQLAKVAPEVRSLYDTYEFNKAIALINKYISNDLSSSYFEWIKDAAYCGTPEERAQVHATIYQIFRYLQQMLAPITPLLIEEVWDCTPRQLQTYEPSPPAQRSWQKPVWTSSTHAQIRNDVPELMKIVTIVKGIQEVERTNKNVGDSLQSYVCIESVSMEVRDLLNRYKTDQLATLFGVSGVKLVGSASDLSELHRAKWCSKKRLIIFGGAVWIHVYEPPLSKCVRCWRYLVNIDEVKSEALCQRCEGVIRDLRTTKPEIFRAT